MVKYRPYNYSNNFNGELALSESNQPLAGALRNSAEKKGVHETPAPDAKTHTIENHFGIPPIGLEGATVEEARDSSETITAQFSVEMDVDEIAKGSISAKAALSIDELAKTVQKIQEEQAAERAAFREEQAKDRAVVKALQDKQAKDQAVVKALQDKQAKDQAVVKALQDKQAKDRAVVKALQDKLDEERAATATEIADIHKAFDGDLQAIAKIQLRNVLTRGEEVFGYDLRLPQKNCGSNYSWRWREWLKSELLPSLNTAEKRLAHLTRVIQTRIDARGLGGADSKLKNILPMDSVDAQNVLSVLLETAEMVRTKGNNAAHERNLDRKLYEEAIRRYEYPENVEGAQEKFTSLLRFVGTTEPTANTTTSQSPSQG